VVVLGPLLRRLRRRSWRMRMMMRKWKRRRMGGVVVYSYDGECGDVF